MVGIIEVAERAGVSTATVSRALNGKSHVSARAREKVLKAAQELGYVASSSAYTLATGRSKNIGVVMPYIDRWFFSAVLDGAVNALVNRGYDVTLYSLSGGPASRKRVFEDLVLRKRVDGVLTVAVKLSEGELKRLSELQKPIVGIGGPIPGARSISIDDEGAGSRPDGCGNGVEVGAEAAGRERHAHHHTTGQLDVGHIAVVAGLQHDDLVTRMHHSEKGGQDRLGRTSGDGDFGVGLVSLAM